MQRKYLLRAALILLLITGSYFVLWAATKARTSKQPCTENMEECSKKQTDKDASGEMIWETFSRQFISISTN